ncbi:MAG: hypothetical protein LKJ88_05125 [Bacilli bacterium]|jgi:hypothetical protein|nr:hypothetical protein [Bacilli bacterium]
MNEVLRDRYGAKLGEIRQEGSRKVIYDRYGARLGYFDGKYTYDRYGRKIGEGNLLVSFLH